MEDWATGIGTVEGWSVFVRRQADPTEPATHWSTVRGPMLTAVVQDNDVAALLGWYDGEEWFGCLLNGSEEEGPTRRRGSSGAGRRSSHACLGPGGRARRRRRRPA